MEERLPKLSDLSFCIFHITSLWLCPTCHAILCPIQPFLSLGWLWGISSLLGTSFRVWFCHWSWTSPWEECGDSPAESIWRALGQQVLSCLLSMDLLTFPAACPIPLDFATIWTTVVCKHLTTKHLDYYWLHCLFQKLPETCFISNKISVNLGCFLKYHLLI